MLRSLSLFLFILASCFTELRSQQLYFNHLSVNNGLSQGVNNCVYKDSRGFVWISSFDGLNRFDGISCINFRSSDTDSTGLKGTLFLNILEDRNGNLWIGSNEGLNFYNRQIDQFQNFSISGRNDDEQFYSPFHIDDRQNIWLQSRGDILVFDMKQKKFRQVYHFSIPGNLLIKPFPTTLFQPLQKIFAVSNNLPVVWEGAIEKEKINWTTTDLHLPGLHISNLLLLNDSSLWLASDKGVLLYRNKQQRFFIHRFQQTELSNVSALHIDKKGILWAGTVRDGLYKIDTAKGLVTDHYTSSVYNSYSLMGNQVQYIYTDDKNNLWVSIWGRGVDYTSLSKFRFSYHVTKEEAVKSDADNFIRSIIQVGNEFWCGTQTGGILILDENKKIKNLFSNGLPASIEHLCVGAGNKVWAATFEGLFIIDPLTRNIRKLKKNEQGFATASNQYNYISNLYDGNMLASSNAGMFIIKPGLQQDKIIPVKGLNTKEVYLTTYTDRLNHIYISKAFKGLGIYSLNADSIVLLKELPIQATIKCFSESTDSVLWIGSTIGLLELNKYNYSIKHIYTTKDGLSNQYIYGIVGDGPFLWLSTNAGINRFDTRTKKVKIFSVGDGLQSNEYNTYSYYKSSTGEILFGGVNGLNSFLPSNLVYDSAAPQLALTGLQLNDATYSPAINQTELKELSVSYKQNTISFQFTVIDFANAASNMLSYTLEDYDKGWVSISNKSLIRYADLPAGHYTLKVKALNAEGIAAGQTYSLPVTIQTPWWQSWWFRLLLGISLVGLVLLFIRNYINHKLEKRRTELEKQQAVENERNRISRDMHDDLGSGLTKIAILSEVVKKQLSEPEKAKEQLEKIAVTSRELVDNLQDIIWVLNPKNDTLESLSSYIREYGLKYFELLSVVIEFNYPEHFSNILLSEEQRRNIFLTLKESFNNITKHAWCNKVTVTIEETTNEILLSIKDDGKGFDVNGVRLFANGLKNMQNRIEQVGGSYRISSQPGKGTLTEIRIYL
jgi:signal transduction histidine kinase/ligand-binding sensor domain-containing protein